MEESLGRYSPKGLQTQVFAMFIENDGPKAQGKGNADDDTEQREPHKRLLFIGTSGQRNAKEPWVVPGRRALMV